MGLKKCSMLHNITACHPDFTIIPTSNQCHRNFFNGITLLRVNENHQPGFVYRRCWFENPISNDPALVLEKAGKQRQLRIVVPPSSDIVVGGCPVDDSKFEQLVVTILALRSDNYGQLFQPNRSASIDLDVVKSMTPAHLATTGIQWKVESRTSDKNGCYSGPFEDTCASNA